MIDLSVLGIVPERTDSVAQARALIRRDGAAILTGRATDEDGARAVAVDIAGATALAIPEPAAVREGGDKDRNHLSQADHLPLHSDGFAYGDQACDLIFLVCVTQGEAGGASYLLDTYKLLEAMPADLAAFLRSIPVDLTEPDMHPTCSPPVLRLPNGREAVRAIPFMSPDPSRTPDEQAADAARIDEWFAMTWRADPAPLPRFTLAPGEALCVDNYRCLHGRDPFVGERFLWRVWCWTTDGNGVPDGALHSDSRYAVVNPQ